LRETELAFHHPVRWPVGDRRNLAAAIPFLEESYLGKESVSLGSGSGGNMNQATEFEVTTSLIFINRNIFYMSHNNIRLRVLGWWRAVTEAEAQSGPSPIILGKGDQLDENGVDKLKSVQFWTEFAGRVAEGYLLLLAPPHAPQPPSPAWCGEFFEAVVFEGDSTVSLGLILVIVLIIFLLGGFSGRFGGYGYGFGHGGVGLIGTILIIIVILMLLGRIWSAELIGECPLLKVYQLAGTESGQ
jgi:hypothetical protein